MDVKNIDYAYFSIGNSDELTEFSYARKEGYFEFQPPYQGLGEHMLPNVKKRDIEEVEYILKNVIDYTNELEDFFSDDKIDENDTAQYHWEIVFKTKNKEVKHLKFIPESIKNSDEFEEYLIDNCRLTKAEFLEEIEHYFKEYRVDTTTVNYEDLHYQALLEHLYNMHPEVTLAIERIMWYWNLEIYSKD